MKIIRTIASFAVLAFASNSAYAEGTIAGTGIENTAQITYNVGGTAQVPIESSDTGNSTPGVGEGTATTFVVDKKVDVNVTTASAGANIVPLGDSVIEFTVTNEGNDLENINLTFLDTVTSATTDEFDATTCTTTVTTVTGTLPATTDPVAAAVNSTAVPLVLAPDGEATVQMTCTAPASTALNPLVNGDTADISLIATAVTTAGGTTTLTASTGIDDPTVKDTVFADASGTAVGDDARDAAHSTMVTYTINTAAIEVKKTQEVISMPFDTTGNGVIDSNVTTGDLYAIPGATVRYTISVTNSGSNEADHIEISDLIPATLTYVAASCTFNTATGGGDAVVNTVVPSPALGCSEASGTVSSSSFTLQDGSTTPQVAILTIDATVN